MVNGNFFNCVAPKSSEELVYIRVRAFQIELEFENVDILGEGQTEVPGKKTNTKQNKTKTSRSKENKATITIYDAGSGNRTRATLVEGERSHHPAPPSTYGINYFA